MIEVTGRKCERERQKVRLHSMVWWWWWWWWCWLSPIDEFNLRSQIVCSPRVNLRVVASLFLANVSLLLAIVDDYHR